MPRGHLRRSPDMSKPLIVLGGCLPQLPGDVKALPIDIASCDVAAVNDAAVLYSGRINYFITCHPEGLVGDHSWKKRRESSGWNTDYITISYRQDDGVDQVAPLLRIPGTSVLYAAIVGLDLGYEPIYIAGSPLDDPEYFKYRVGWMAYAYLIAGRVYSMSGWTKIFLEEIAKWH